MCVVSYQHSFLNDLNIFRSKFFFLYFDKERFSFFAPPVLIPSLWLFFFVLFLFLPWNLQSHWLEETLLYLLLRKKKNVSKLWFSVFLPLRIFTLYLLKKPCRSGAFYKILPEIFSSWFPDNDYILSLHLFFLRWSLSYLLMIHSCHQSNKCE